MTVEQKQTLTASEVLLGLECELEICAELWSLEFSCGEKLVPAKKEGKPSAWVKFIDICGETKPPTRIVLFS